jgi:hypothetical protein
MKRITDPQELAAYRRKHAPELAQHFKSKTGDAEAWAWTNGTRLFAVGFLGRAQSPYQGSTFCFRTAEQRMRWVAGLFNAATSEAKYRQEREAAKTAARAKPHGLKVGDVLRSSWGYDQTNVDFYQVTALIGSQTVEYRPIGQESEQTEFMQGECVPCVGKFTGPAKRARVSTYGERDSISVGFSSARKMTPTIVAGVPVYQSSHWTAYA